jgi:hypothetical protein
MKTTFALAGLALALCSLCPAQDSSAERIVVPARNSSRPRKVTAHMINGSVTVKAYAGKEVIVEAAPGISRSSNRPAMVDGMHRLDLPPRGLTVEEEENQIKVSPGPMVHGPLTITVPVDTSLDLHTMHGEINVEGVHGELVVDCMNGKATLTNVSGNVLAHSLNGAIKVTMDRVDANKPLSFITLNGSIDVTLPADYKGNVKVSSQHGAIYTDFDIKIGPGTITQPNTSSEPGKFRLTIGDRAYVGTINGGGAEATFRSLNGPIYIRKKK